jgi:hypothetical protein
MVCMMVVVTLYSTNIMDTWWDYGYESEWSIDAVV